MSNTVTASIPVLRWAAGRARLSDDDLQARFRKWPLWLTGETQPTLRQLELFARLTHTAIGYFFLPQPPVLELPVPDFRTLGDRPPAEPSSELLDTLYLCQQRQDWYQGYLKQAGETALPFVGSARTSDAPEAVAQKIRDTLGFSVEQRRALATWTHALRLLMTQAEEAGVLVMASSIVGSNSHRKLDVEEFRGFALVDDWAPLVFLNAADSKAAQMFTLAHELAHLWLGTSGVSDMRVGRLPEQQIERWCNRVAAELLMPTAEVTAAYRVGEPTAEAIQRLAREFKVSTLVVLRRLCDAGFISETQLWNHYRKEQERLRRLERGQAGGGDFYRTLGTRTGRRFARAIIASTLEGITPFTEAFQMLGVRKTATFYEAAREFGVTA